MGIQEGIDPTRVMVEPQEQVFAHELAKSRSGLVTARDYLVRIREKTFKRADELGIVPKSVPDIREAPAPPPLLTRENMPKVPSDWLQNLPEGIFVPGAITSNMRPPRENLGSEKLLAAIDAATQSSDAVSDERARTHVDEQKEQLSRATRQVFFNSMGQQAGYINTETGAKYNFASSERLVRDSLGKEDFILKDGRAKNIAEWEKDYLPTKTALPNNWQN